MQEFNVNGDDPSSNKELLYQSKTITTHNGNVESKEETNLEHVCFPVSHGSIYVVMLIWKMKV